MKINVTCPHCNQAQAYHQRPGTKRPRFTCSTCKKRVDLHRGRITNAPKPAMDQHVRASLSGEQKTIISMLTGDPPRSRESMCKALGLSRGTLHNRIEWLVRIGVLVKRPTRPRTYIVNPDLEKKGDDLAWIFGAHKLHFTLPVIGGYDRFARFRNALPDKNDKLRSWVRKYLYLNEVRFEINLHGITAWTFGVGASKAEAITNAKNKCVQMRDMFVNKFGLTLGFPVFHWETGNERPEYTPMCHLLRCNIEDLQRFWNDATHKDLWETDDPLLAETLQKAIQLRDENAEKIVELQRALDASKVEHDVLKTEVETIKAAPTPPGPASDDIKDLKITIDAVDKRMTVLDTRIDNMEAIYLRMESSFTRLVDVLEQSTSRY